MAMMISKFNQLIRSRLLWGAFLVIIVFSFVIWGMVWPSDLNRAEEADAAGRLDGELISSAEFRSAYLSAYLGRALTLGRDLTATPETEARLRQSAWERLATLREAAALGISASDEELIQVLRANFSDTNGVYQPQRYQTFLQNAIRPLGFTPAQFEEHVREEIAIQKLGQLIARQAQVTPLEIRRTFDTLLDEYTVEYALVTEEDVADRVSLDEAAARSLYEAQPEAFTRSEQRLVSYVAFPLADYLDNQQEFSDEEIQDYYEQHIDDFTTRETVAEGTTRESIADLDEVRDEIIRRLRRQAAMEKADAEASELAFRALPGRDGIVPDFAAEAQKSGRTAVQLPPFSREEIPLEDGGAAFTAAAFERELDAFDRVSAPIRGQDQVYVIYLEKKIPPRVPDFEEVREEALAAAREKALDEALAARAAEIKAAAEAGLAAGKTFPEALRPLGVSTKMLEPFTGLSGSTSTNTILQALVASVVSHNAGEVTDPIPIRGGRLVGYLKARAPADSASYESYRDEIAGAIRARRGQTRFRDWQASLLAPERFTDLRRTTEIPETEEEDSSAEEPGPGESEEPM